MTDNGIELSRRKILASMGAIGAAGAGAGLGTSAYFSDEESFTDNSITAGELDMKVDWTEHYSDWSDDEAEGVSVSMTDETLGYGFPSAASNKMVYVDDKDQFLANTAIESFPDTLTDNPSAADYDGQQTQFENDSDVCDLDADLSGVLSHNYRTGANVDGGVTIGDGPNPQTTAAGDPLVNISDVKPGDFGEVTFSFHICGNPGYVWLTGELADADENGNTEPEADDEDEIGPGEDDPQNRDLFDNEGDEDSEPSSDPANTTQEPVELLDTVRTALWYDTGSDGLYGANYSEKDGGEGDNYHESGEAFIPLTGSLRNVLKVLNDGMVPLDYTPVGDGVMPSGVDGYDVCTSTSDAIYTLRNSDLGYNSARNVSCEELDEALITNGTVEAGTEYVGTKIEAGALQQGVYTAGNGGIIRVESVDIDAGTVTLSTNFPIEAVKNKGGNEGANYYVFEDQGGTEDDGTAEQFGCILDNVQFSTPTGQAISNIELCYDPSTPTDSGEQPDDGRECFPNSTTAYVGFEWWVPTDVGNEIQGDSVKFDLGFYTEQCRHNTNPGQSLDGSTSSGGSGGE